MTAPAVPFNKPFIAGRELYYIAQAVVNGHLSGDGHYTRLCHAWLESRLGSPKALLTPSCTDALEMAALLCDIRPGDEVVMPSFTFVSTANAFVLRGATPVFVDIREDTLNIDERLIERALTAKTRAVVAVHYAGVPCAMDEILQIAASSRLYVVEDAAQSLLSAYRNRYLGAIGHLGCLSFHETKNIISGEGGALLVNDPALIDRAEVIREKGTNRNRFFRGEIDKYTWIDIGSSYLPSELVGAFLYAQLEQSETIVAARRRLFHAYIEQLTPLAEKGVLRLPFVDRGCTPNGHIFYIIARDGTERSRLIRHLKDRRINTVFHYVPLHSSPAGRRFGRTSGDMTVTDDLSERVLRLPMYFEMTEDAVTRVAAEIAAFYGSGRS